MTDISLLDPHSLWFPPTDHALTDPNGLLAVGGDLSPERLVAAYQKGIFPWFDDTSPILWWSPSPRLVLAPSDIRLNRSLLKLAKKTPFIVTVDTAFEDVIHGCAEPRPNEDGTWITDDMIAAYCELHRRGVAHSIETWQNEQLVGGLYGVALNGVFFGESMFSRTSGASKVAFATLCLQLKEWNYSLVDCQVNTDYLSSFGAEEIDRAVFEERLTEAALSGSEKNAVNWPEAWKMPDYGFTVVDGKPHFKTITQV